MKKRTLFIVLLLLAFLFGLWLARENRQFFKAMGLIENPPSDVRPMDWDAVSIGMETWQVKDVVGAPEERNVERDGRGTRREEWIYGDKRLLFTDGILTSLGERGPEGMEP
jgi:hypothetical protein